MKSDPASDGINHISFDLEPNTCSLSWILLSAINLHNT